MIIDMPLTDKILIESSKTVKFRTIKASFGDGYSQRAADGINSKVDSWEVRWGALTREEMSTIESALDSIGGHGIIKWTPCGETVEKRFINSNGSYSRNRVGSIYAIAVSLEQVYDIIG